MKGAEQRDNVRKVEATSALLQPQKVLRREGSYRQKFLEQRWLALSGEKTVITHINDGFDFLGWNFRKFKGKLIIKPSHKSMGKITTKISGVIKDNRAATQETLIRKLNEVIVGWANYHHSTCAKRSFGTIDHRICKMLWR